MQPRFTQCLAMVALGAALGAPRSAADDASQQGLPARLRDRGPGVATSMFATYVARGELIVYPFFEYYRGSLEYKPEEFGFAGQTDYLGRYRAKEGLLFLAYGLTDDLAWELEAATIRASLVKAPADSSALPARLEESGLGDVETQLRWRWRREDERGPELFSYGEAVFPHHRRRELIGTPGLELKLGTGVTRGFGFGTLTARAAVDYATSSSSRFDLGECALEYIRRPSPAWRVYVGLEGRPDELSLIGDVQWHLSRRAFLRLNSGFGLSRKAADWTPEIGIVFTLPTR
jgi:hypothetical protein